MEKWIWTELPAFDRDAADRGVASYLDTLGFVPDGISLLLTAIDFVMLHETWQPERPLFPDVCSRMGHDGNGIRARQEWRCGELRDLVLLLRQRRIKVFFSLFPYYLGNRFHPEFAAAHPECRVVSTRHGLTNGVSLISRLDNGEYFDALFAERLERVFADYGFDGFHGADGMGPGGLTLGTNDYSPNMLAQFHDSLGVEEAPWPAAGDGFSGLPETAGYIWEHLWPEWCEFNARRWRQCWSGIIAAARKLGRETMINSPNTRGLFDGLYQYGFDYAGLDRLGVDYLLVETVAPGFRLLDGGHEFQLEFAAQLMEFAAAMPHTRMLFLHGVRDAVESYDLLRHAPSWIEGDFFLQSNLFIRRDGALKTAADGFMVCLGDGLDRREWRNLRQLWSSHAPAAPVQEAGELVWVWHRHAAAGLCRSYPVNGDWPGCKVIAELGRHSGCTVQCVAEPGESGEFHQPLVVPNAEFLPAAELEQLLKNPVPVLLLGKLDAARYPEADGAITCSGCAMAALFFHTGEPFPRETVPSDPQPFAARIPEFNYTVLPDYMKVPEAFFRRCAERLRRHTGRDCRLAGEKARLFHTVSDGRNRYGAISDAPGYLSLTRSDFPVGRGVGVEVAPRFRSVRKLSDFPLAELALDGGRLCSRSGSPVNLAPYGVLLFELDTEAANFSSSSTKKENQE
ncbi:MAG: hypothetical protein HPZ91_10260 [Lentisphaeria bacterium]|nr:hypothetical protein [Lentisphaeria bacterium]